MKTRTLSMALALALPHPALAQDSEEDRDRGFIAGLIEDNLSSPGLQIRIDGFEGALSSRASIDLLQISDEEGAWLRMEDVVLDWNRSALLRGRLEVEELSAARIVVERTPLPPEGVDRLPDAGASGFSLPELPVAVDIEALHADRIELGAPLLGQDLALTLDATAQLADGAGSISIEAQRIDETAGRYSIQASYGGEGQPLSIDLDISEPEGGVAATLLQLPGDPAIDLTVKGNGPLDDFSADIALASDGQDRLAGQVTLTGTEDGRRFDVDLGGDVTELFAPRYKPFFGENVQLVAQGLQRDGGGIDLDWLQVDTQALDLSGEARIGADGWPEYIDLTGSIASDDGTPVLLPTSSDARIRQASLTVRQDASVSDDWRFDLSLQDYDSPALSLETANLTATGTLERADSAVTGATAAIQAALDGLDFADPDLARAVGDAVTLSTDLAWDRGQPVRLGDLSLDGAGYGLDGSVTIAGADPEHPLNIGMDLSVMVDDLARLSGVAGRDLSGSADATVTGDFSPLAGTFDLTLGARTRDLGLGIPQADAVLSGETTLALETRRTVDGTFVDDLNLSNAQLSVEGSAALLAEEAAQRQDGQTSRATLSARLADGTAIDPRLDGPVDLSADLTQDAAGVWQGTVEGRAPQGIALSASGTLTGEAPDVEFSATVPDLEPFAPGVPGGVTLEGRAFARDGIWSLDADATGPWNATATVEGPVTGEAARIAFSANLPDLSGPVPAVETIEALRGAVTLDGTLAQQDGAWVLDTRAEAPSGITLRAEGPVTGESAQVEFAGTVPEISDFVPAVEGRLDVDGRVAKTADDWMAQVTARGPFGAVVTAETVLTASPLVVDFTADVPDLSELAPVPGGLSVTGQAVQTDDGFLIDLDGTGPYAATVDATVDLTGDAPAIEASGRIPESSALAPQLRGPLTYAVTASQTDGQWQVDATVDGAQGLSAAVDGIATGPDAALDFRLSAADVSPFVPGLNGALSASGRLFQQDGQWAVDLDASGPLRSTLTASGTLTGQAPQAQFTLAVPDIGPLTGISGPLRVSGTARGQGDAYAIDIDLQGPSGTQAAVDGTIGTDGTLNLSVDGSAPLGLANAALAPRRLAGTANFDLTLNGPPSLDSVSGRITTSGAALSLPTLRNGLEAIDATVTLTGGRAQVDLSASPQSGGRLSVTGPVTLSPPFDANLVADFDITLEDPSLYTADLDGRVTVTGPLTGGATIGGVINIDGAEIAVPSSGLTAVGDLPEIRHLSTPRPVQRTLARAGQTEEARAEAARAESAGPAYGLDLTINAPGRIFVRGRGLDAELGGTLRLMGTTKNPITSGGFELVRGRLDILEQRFDLDEGRISFQGSLVPYIRLVATTQTDTITASIVIEGPADDIGVTFESVPEVPQEEVVAQIFFGRGLDQLSPLQALQLANSIAVLAGRSSGGLLDNLRGSAGLDDLDITTDDDGNVALRAGKYLSDNVYTDVQVDQNGEAAISLNLDVSPNLTVRGSAGAAGGTALGLFYERDY
ncbi:translocation/assembly module TamB domain-containing protein [Jannaschia rubra]|uniref:Translocation and assembly module TamB C-terminal domain-containing protein n=1 Tax=Jannaschia rubra TaxID=282197 RepID=A0A0M6XUM4_9RHOB|nr:translocation/assembly module TamB domain-containing protein [Jannaschia rubra]CTQ33624.1 hypothetical protein JAN5088_02408 [Jannaschia rubra]SFG05137.1 autotransporter secretion inner membrane protein TamB [Jannaschia rubra]